MTLPPLRARVLCGLLAALALSLLLAASAGATTITLGHPGTPTVNTFRGAEGLVPITSNTPSDQWVVPQDGTITSWSGWLRPNSPTDSFELALVRETAPNVFTRVAISDPLTDLTGIGHYTATTDLQAHAGDRLALLTYGLGAVAISVGSDSLAYLDGDGRDALVAGSPATSRSSFGDTIYLTATLDVPAPAPASVTPASGSNAGGETVTISGQGFDGATGVDFGGVPAPSFSVVDDATITAVVPPSAAAVGGAVDVHVTGPSGVGTAAAGYTYAPVPAPIVTATSASSGSVLGGDTVTLTGDGFDTATGVLFGDVPATSFQILDAHTITAVVPPLPAGAPTTVMIHVVGPGGASVDALTYVYLPPVASTGPPPFQPPPALAAKPLGLTLVSSGPRCVASSRGAARRLVARLRLSDAATVRLTLQRRVEQARRPVTSCPKPAPSAPGIPGSAPRPEAPAAYRDVHRVAAHGRRAAAAAAVAVARPTIATSFSAAAGSRTVALLTALKETTLAPGRYRVAIVARRADGSSATAYVYVRALDPRPARRRAAKRR